MGELQKLLLGWLPTQPAKVTLLLTVTLSTAPFLLPEFLFADRPIGEPAQLWLQRLVVSLAVGLVGSLVIVGLVLRHYRNPILSISVVEEKPKSAWEWIEDPGVWKDKITNIRYCVKCEGPLRTAKWGYACDKCGRHFQIPEYRKKQEEEAAAEQRRVDAMIRNRRI